MGRRLQLDTDEERLPEGMRRTGYDSDSQTYFYSDADGKCWESAPGQRYGKLVCIDTGSEPSSPQDDTSTAGGTRKVEGSSPTSPATTFEDILEPSNMLHQLVSPSQEDLGQKSTARDGDLKFGGHQGGLMRRISMRGRPRRGSAMAATSAWQQLAEASRLTSGGKLKRSNTAREPLLRKT
ncbi:hypothetical protein NM208_g490 [Fusarium decemcellulare]|uniref:Uncharacterized protein n=1 Tax=Fusarium decemcellulare TaxID=57161 RepID=A0ACC1SZN6_9HYPO|nr:hypothetical protein NM208_g490 [Fusarium decemcellulare]